MIAVDIDRCTGCGQCVSVCPTGAISVRDNRVQVADKLCTGCQACVRACPQGALVFVAETEEVSSLQSTLPARRTARLPVPHRPGRLVAVGGALAMIGRVVLPPLLDWALNRPPAPGTSRKFVKRQTNALLGGGRRLRRRRLRNGGKL